MTPDAEATAAAEVLAAHWLANYGDGEVWRDDDPRHGYFAEQAAALRDANLLADPNLTAERDRARDAIFRVTHTGQRWVTDAEGHSFWALRNEDLLTALAEERP